MLVIAWQWLRFHYEFRRSVFSSPSEAQTPLSFHFSE
jgi:hypothetical protein